MIFQKSPETTESRYFGYIRQFIDRRIAKKNKNIGARLDALLKEKAHNEGINITLKRELTLRYLFASIGLLMAVFVLAIGIWIVRPDLYLPLIRMVAPPRIVAAELKGIDFTEQGVEPAVKEMRIAVGKEMDARFVAPLVKISPAVKYEISVSQDKKEIIITPKEDLANGTNYTVELKPGLVFTDGSYMVSNQSWVIPVRPEFAVTGITPADGSTAPFTSAIEVVFNRDSVDIESFKKVFSITPALDGRFEKNGSTIVYVPHRQLVPGTVYTVKIAEGLEIGGEIMKKSAQSVFTVSNFSNDNSGSYQGPSISFPVKIYNVSQDQQDAVDISGIKKVNLEMYAIAPDKVQGIADQIARGNAVTWETFLKDVPKGKTITLTQSSGNMTYFGLNDLGKGAFILKAVATDNDGFVGYQLVLKGSTGTHVTVDTVSGKLHTWTFNYATSAPADAADVSLFSCTKSGCTQVANQKTADNGYSQFNSTATSGYTITSFDGGLSLSLFGSIFNGWNGNGDMGYYSRFDSDLIGAIETNKPFYSPGETIKFSVYLRQRSNGDTITPASGRTFKFAVCLANDLSFYEGENNGLSSCLRVNTVTLDENGKFTGEVPLIARREGLFLRVAEQIGGIDHLITEKFISIVEVEKPKFVLDANFIKDQFVFGDSIVMSGRLTDYAGNGVSGKNISVAGVLTPVAPRGTASGALTNNEFISLNGTSGLSSVTATTDASGNFLIALPIKYTDLSSYTYKASISAGFQDGSNSTSVQREIVFTKGNDYLVRAQQDGKDIVIANKAKPASIRLKAVSIFSGAVIPDKKATISVQRSWNEMQEAGTVYNQYTKKTEKKYVSVAKSETVLASKAITFTTNGEYAFDVKDLKNGQYTLTIAEASGAKSTYFLFNLYDGSTSEFSERVTSFGFSTDIATVGEKVSLLLQHTFKKTDRKMVMLVETEKLLNWSFVDVSNPAIEFQVTREMVGGVRVCLIYPVLVLDDVDGKIQNLGSGIDDNNCTYLTVEDPTQKLTMKITPEKPVYKPGETVNASVEITDSEGKPVAVETGIAVIDKALKGIDLNPEFWTEELYDKYYLTLRGNFPEITSSSSYFSVLSRGLGNFGGRGSGASSAGALRKNFNDAPFWSTSVKTDNSGKASISFTLPDSITKWVIKGWAISPKTQVGNTYAEFVSQRDTYLIVDNPQYVRQGDTWTGSITVVNTTDKQFSGTLNVACDTCLERPNVVSVTVGAKSSSEQKVTFKLNESHAKVVSELRSNNNTVDSIETKLNVRPVDLLSTSRVFSFLKNDSSKIQLNLGSGVSKDSSTIEVMLTRNPFSTDIFLEDPSIAASGNIAGSTLSSVYLYENYDKVGKTLGISKEELLSKVKYNASILLNRQRDGGGFGWFDYDAVDPVTSAQIARLFGEMNSSEPAITEIIPNTVSKKLEAYIISMLKSDTATTADRIKLMKGLAYLNKEVAVTYVTSAFAQRDKLLLSLDDKLELAAALLQAGDSADASYLVNSLNASRKVSDFRAELPFFEKYSGIALIANLNQKMHSAMLDQDAEEQYQQWLMSQSVPSGNLAFSHYAAVIDIHESFANSVKSTATIKAEVLINGKSVGTKEIKDKNESLVISGDSLQDGNNEIEIKTAKGQLFAFVSQKVISASQIKSKAGAVVIKQELVNMSKSGKPFSVGDVGYVKLTLSPQEDANRLVVRDYVPAGFTVLSTYSQYVSFDFIKLLGNNKNTLATGDLQSQDFVSAYLFDVKQSEARTVIYPIMAIRKGTWTNHVTYAGNDLVSDSVAINVALPIEVK